jgi:hypothetical protein
MIDNAELMRGALSAVFVEFPQRFCPEVYAAVGKTSLWPEPKVSWTKPDAFVCRLFQFDRDDKAEIAYYRICSLLFYLDAIGSRIWLRRATTKKPK